MQAWVPMPSIEEADWIVPEGDEWTGNAATAEIVTDPAYGARMLHATFAEASPAPVARAGQPLPHAATAPPTCARPARRRRSARPSAALYLAATELMPTDGIVEGDRRPDHRRRRRRPGEGAGDLRVGGRQHAADAETRGCGIGDVASMLASGNLGGKCADLNALYVALARASGIPARDLYGIRVAPSASATRASAPARRRSPSRSTAAPRSCSTAAAGCRSIPADVRKVVLEEPPGDNALDFEVVVGRARQAVRRLGGQLARLQRRPRRAAAGIGRTRSAS